METTQDDEKTSDASYSEGLTAKQRKESTSKLLQAASSRHGCRKDQSGRKDFILPTQK